MGTVPEGTCKKRWPSEGNGVKSGSSVTPEILPSWLGRPPFGLNFLSFSSSTKTSLRGQHFSSLSSWQAEAENIFVEFLSPNHLSRFASKRKKDTAFPSV